MNRAKWVILAAILLAGLTRAHGQDGRLQHVRDDVRSPASSNSPSSDDSSSGWGDSSSGDSGGGSGDGGWDAGVVGLVVLSPFLIPMAILKDESSDPLDFAPHPYANGYRGYQLPTILLAEMFRNNPDREVHRKDWAGRFLLENGNDFAGLNRSGLQLKLEHANRLGITTNWNYFNENLCNGRRDETWIGDTNITFRFAQNEIASMYSGLGFRMLTDRKQTDFGFNFTYGGDWFPVRPLIVSGVLDAGTLGSAGVLHLRGSVGAIWRGVEVFGGYDFLRIGATNLQGPTAGVRFWF